MHKFFNSMINGGAGNSAIISDFVSRKGIARDDDIKFSEVTISGKIKDFLSVICGFEMAVFGIKYPYFNGALVAIIYCYHSLLRMVAHIASFLSGLSNSTANQLGAELMTNGFYIYGTVFILGIITACIALSLFRFFMRAFVLITTVFMFVEGPGRSLFIDLGIQGIIPPLLLGTICGLILMVYLEKVVRKGLLILIFAVVGSAMLFLGIGEVFNLNSSIAKSVITLTPVSGEISEIIKEYALFWCTVAVSILIQIFTRK
ncbi:hypothetical protein NEMIN01_2439 [Nematocida minor]|uniref:uncharacterized protein n=1 Tax=Nematocida minor TaxID=1912983 RepID=UPI00221FED8C|nr:uncharacterized protein NEMIN01_2439 [Nematocida minor]KAI5193274.1 hypothetical protein NEMIN01_2439 [Nematocida minor]